MCIKLEPTTRGFYFNHCAYYQKITKKCATCTQDNTCTSLIIPSSVRPTPSFRNTSLSSDKSIPIDLSPGLPQQNSLSPLVLPFSNTTDSPDKLEVTSELLKLLHLSKATTPKMANPTIIPMPACSDHTAPVF